MFNTRTTGILKNNCTFSVSWIKQLIFFESCLENGKAARKKKLRQFTDFLKNEIQYGREKKEKLSSSVILFEWEVMAVSKLLGHSVEKEPDESSDVSALF